MKIAVLGGSFNPPHICHVFISCYVLATAAVDQLWFVPCYKHAFGKELAPFAHRFAMCTLAVEGLRPEVVKISTLEQDRQGTSWTIDTARSLKTTYPEHEFIWIIGSDVLDELEHWKDFDQLHQFISFLVIPRAGSGPDLPAHPPVLSNPAGGGSPRAATEPSRRIMQGLRNQVAEFERLDFQLPNVSSTLIRARVKQKQPIDHLVPKNVAAYIHTQQLYEE